VPHVVRFESPGVVSLAEYEDDPVADSQVLIETLYSGISAGTELTAAYGGTNPYTNKRWDEDRRLFVEGGRSIDYPIDGWGYEEVGRVAGVGARVTGVGKGQVIYGTWGHRSTNRAPGEWAAARILPEGLDAIVGVFSRIGAIALNSILDADIHLGETVAVFGQGVPGLIAGQLARLSGATVVAIDAIPRRLELARRLGAHHVVNVSEADAAEQVKAITGGRGADVAIEISGSYRALHAAIRCVAYNSRVVSAGFFQGEATGLFLGEEFHHNRPQIVASQISGLNPSLDHRWTVERMERTVMGLADRGDLDLAALISHVLPAGDCADAFRLLAERPEEAVQVVLAFAGAIPEDVR
jgi:threonine dehydrogenase-like Zn-dependent dehydrogenase